MIGRSMYQDRDVRTELAGEGIGYSIVYLFYLLYLLAYTYSVGT